MQLPTVGERFEGRYEILGKLGRGGFATVLLARDHHMSREVALKLMVPNPEHDIERLTARFEREAKTIADLQHPGILRLYDFGRSHGGLLYMAFEYIPGGTVAELANGPPVGPVVAVSIIGQVLDALVEVHRAGYVHRDLKPSNIAVTPQPDGTYRARLLDFGIAKMLQPDDGQPALTMTGAAIGTPAYMAPEQFAGRPVSPATDVFSLGIIAVELIDGAEESRSVMGRARKQAFHDANAPSYPLRLDGVAPSAKSAIASMIQGVEDRRPTDASQALSMLWGGSGPVQSVPAPRPSPSRPVAPSPPPSPTWRDPRAIAILLVLLIVAGTAVAITVAVSSDPEPARAVPRRVAPAAVVQAPSHTLQTKPPAETPPQDPAVDDAGEAVRKDGCGLPPEDVRWVPMHAGIGLRHDRWLTYIPYGYDPNLRHPLVITLRRDFQPAREFADESGFVDLAERERFVVLAPPLAAGTKTVDRSPDIATDVVAMVDETASRLCIDRKRIYVVGYRHGVYPTLYLDCEPWVAASAHVHNLPKKDEETFGCDNPRPIPNITMIPTQSKNEPINGGTECISGVSKVPFDRVQALWRSRNQCKDRSKPWFSYRGSACVQWDCETPYVTCELQGGDVWPGMRFPIHENFAGCNGPEVDFPIAERIWKFFSSLPVD